MKIISRSQGYCLVEEYLYPGEKMELRSEWGYEQDSKLFAHVVYNYNTLELIYYRASSEEFHDELPNACFIAGWLKLISKNEEERRMYKITYSLPPSQAPRNIELPDVLEQILSPTKGYLLYKEQMSDILKLVKHASPNLIPMYIRNWNLKKPITRFMASTVYVQGINLDHLIEDRIYDTDNKFLYS